MAQERSARDLETPPSNADPVDDPAGPGIVRATDVLPDRLPIIPLRTRPYFPGLPAPIPLRPDQFHLIQTAARDHNETVGLALVRDADLADTPENLHHVGVAAKLLKAVQSNPETMHVIVNCLQRFVIKHVEKVGDALVAHVRYKRDPDVPADKELRAYAMAIVSTLKDLVQLDPIQSEAIRLYLSRNSFDDPAKLADFAANLTTADADELQDVLGTFDVRKRIDKVLVLLKKEVELAKLQGQISRQIEEKITRHQREFFLREQLKAIKQELGLEKDGKSSEVERFQERLAKLDPPADVKAVIIEELEKFQLLESSSSEYGVTRNYLDWLTILPWGRLSADSYDLDHARKILDRDHHGLEDVKERILEFIAVGRRKGAISGSILCLVGPPGVGKTSIGRSIAETLGRRFYRFSLGGMRDEAEIKGHRRTYIGAMPGKFIQAMKTAGTANPVIMLDEIDKIGASFQGDPASALLEVLDPEQNAAFRDHYLDVPFDLSHVLFVATANELDTIPAPLLDRMEVIRLSGYILEEKLEIARRHLLPRVMGATGLKRGQVRISPEALKHVIDGYAREAGVRGLENQLRKVMRKAAVEMADEPTKIIVLELEDIERLLGQPFFSKDLLFTHVPGIATGLAWTSLGGVTLQVEATAMPSSSQGFKQTGQLGKVMQESADIAYSFVMAHLADYGVGTSYFEEHFVHLHVPAGATRKDGPSAGITMATALISMVRGKPVRKNLGMTGELTLTGQVLPIGGVKEKLIAARRAGLKTLVFPAANRRDFDELPLYLRRGLTVHFAEKYEDVYAVAFAR